MLPLAIGYGHIIIILLIFGYLGWILYRATSKKN